MRGIAGILYPDFFQMNERIYPMLETIRHRNGSAHEVHTFKNLEIGLVGDTAFLDEQKSVIVGVDGNILNRKELCGQLRNQGYPLPCETDSELLLYAYETWGVDCIAKLRGDFALMILDRNKEKLILARNRIGKKPLYWYQDENHFIFASELKSLLATGLVPQTPALDAMASYLYFGYIPQDLSPIEGVSKLLPAHYIELSLDGTKSIRQYWSLGDYFQPKSTSPQEQLIHHLDDLIQEAVKIRLPNSDPVAAFMSGGLGSSSLSYYLKKNLPNEKIHPFSVGFAGQNEDDVQTAEQVCDHLHLHLQSSMVEQNHFLDDLVSITWYLDEPLADPNVVAIWNLAKMAAPHVKTVYTGMGFDEIFAGHMRYVTTEAREQMVRYQEPFAWMRKILAPLFNRLYKPAAYRFLKQARTNPWQFEYLSYNALFPESEIGKVSPRLENVFDPETFLHKFHRLSQVKSRLDSYLYFDIKTRLPDDYILMVERITAAFHLDWCAPYLDRDLVQFAAGLPEPETLTEKETARYLKTILQDKLPASVIQRPKVTRRYFLRSWLSSPAMRDIYELLSGGILVEEGLVSEAWLKQQIQQLSVSPDAFRWLWAILVLEIWYRLYINFPVSTTPPDMTVQELLQTK